MILAITTPGVPELIVIALIFVLLFGARKLPELGGAIGKSIKSFKAGVEDSKDDEAAQEPDAAADTTATRDGQ
jgi:sec-independent protein translocase protein TatA